jgi:hypothetical protein
MANYENKSQENRVKNGNLACTFLVMLSNCHLRVENKCLSHNDTLLRQEVVDAICCCVAAILDCGGAAVVPQGAFLFVVDNV